MRQRGQHAVAIGGVLGVLTGIGISCAAENVRPAASGEKIALGAPTRPAGAAAGRETQPDGDDPSRRAVTTTAATTAEVLVRVVHLDDGAPVPAAWVAFHNLLTGENSWHRTDKAGLSRAKLPAGRYRVDCRSEYGDAGRVLADPLVLKEGQSRQLTVRLMPQPRYRGVVRDREGWPVEGAFVALFGYSNVRQVRTRPDGAFEVIRCYSLLDSNAWVRPGWLLVRHLERSLASVEDLPPLGQAMKIRLDPAATLVGQLVDPDGKAVAGAWIRILLHLKPKPPGGGGSIHPHRLRTDAEGRFEIRALPVWRVYTLEIWAKGFVDLNKDVQVWKAGRVDLGPIVLSRARPIPSPTTRKASDRPARTSSPLPPTQPTGRLSQANARKGPP